MNRLFVVVSLTLFLCVSSETVRAQTVDVRASVFSLVSHRNIKLAGAIGKGSGIHPGFQATIRVKSLWGLSARILGGSFSRDSSAEARGTEAVGKVNNVDVDLMAGPTAVHGILGFGVRSVSGAFGAQRWRFVRLGGRSELPLGANRFHVSLLAAVYLAVSGAEGASGRVGETNITYTHHCGIPGNEEIPEPCRVFGMRVPDLFIGYRFEQFTAHASEAAGSDRPEEVGSAVFGITFRFDD